MAQPWSTVVSNPEFKKLAPADQEAARQQYFNEVVAPQVQPEALSNARQEFDSQTKPGVTQKTPGVLHTVGDLMRGAVDTANAFKGGVNHGLSFGMIPQAPEAGNSPIAAGAGEVVGSVMGGGALERGVASLAGHVAPGMVSKLSSALALREGSPISNLLRLSGHGAMSGGAQGAVSGGVQGAENGGVTGAVTGAAEGGALGAAGGAVVAPAAGLTGKVIYKGVDALQGASQRALKLLADKLNMPSARLQQMFTDFRAATGRNPSIADVLDARSKADIAPIIQSRGSSQATMNEAAQGEAEALPGRVQGFTRRNGQTQTPFAPAPQSTDQIGRLQEGRDAAATQAMAPIRDMRVPLDTQSKDVLLSQTLRNVPLSNADRFKINNEIANDHITVGSVDLLRQKLQKIAAADPASSAGVLARDIGEFGRFHSQEYAQMLDDYAAHSRFINGFEHAAKGRDIADAELPLRRDLQSVEGAAGLELGARSRMVDLASTETGANGVINKVRQPTAANPNLSAAENARLNAMANAETRSQQNYADLSGRVKSRGDEQGEAVSRAIEGVAATAGHTLTGFKTHFFSRMLTKAGVRESTANALTETLLSKDPARIAALPQQIQDLRITAAERRRVLETAARVVGKPVGAFAGDVGSSK